MGDPCLENNTPLLTRKLSRMKSCEKMNLKSNHTHDASIARNDSLGTRSLDAENRVIELLFVSRRDGRYCTEHIAFPLEKAV